MDSKWETLPIKKVYKGLYDGPHATPKPSDAGPVFLGIKNIREDGTLDLSEIRHISEEEYPKWIKRVEPNHGDIVFSYEATLNRYTIIPKGFRGCLGRRLALIRPDNLKINTSFLYFYFFSNEWRSVISQNTLTGSTVDRIPLTQFPDFPIMIPPLYEQDKIAAILSAYNDLIENNLRRIKILEEMAQNLYREWFVNFRFPGHEKSHFVDSPLGRIPEGWEISKLGEQLVALESGKRPKGGIQDIKGGIPSVGAENINGIGKHNYQNEKYVTEEFFESIKKGKVEDRDIGLYKDGAYIGKSTYFRDGFPHKVFCVNEHVFLMRSSGISITQNWLYLWLQELSTISAIRATNANAAQPGINQKGIKGLSILVPPVSIIKKFDFIVEPYLALIIRLAKKNNALRQTRDLLLPKLISGEVDVSELDISVPKEVAI